MEFNCWKGIPHQDRECQRYHLPLTLAFVAKFTVFETFVYASSLRHLPGMVAALTPLPVPLALDFNGFQGIV